LSDIIVSTFGSVSLIGVAAWLGREWLKERLTASVRLETDQKLTKFKAELEAANQRIRDLASAGSAATAEAQSALLEHRIAAVKKVWESVQAWQQVSVPTMMVSALPDDWVKKNASDPGTKSTFEQALKGIDYPSFMKTQNQTELVRPFLSESAWAMYFAYHTFLSTRLAKAKLLTIAGIDHAALLPRLGERELVAKSATAEILAEYDNNPYSATEPYLRFLRESMLTEFRESLSGQRAGNQAVLDAAEILRAAEDLAARSSTTARETAKDA
jgi:hypothetical protein